MEMKKCKKCGVSKEKNEDNFHWRNDLNNWRATCKTCIHTQLREYKEENEDKIKIMSKKYYENNKEKIILNVKEYEKNNKDFMRNYRRQRKKNKRKEDPVFMLRDAISTRISQYLKKKGSSKNGDSIIKYLSFTINELINYLESLFEPWMTWENRGLYNPKIWNDDDPSTWTWQIDHIIPQSDLPYTSMEDENFKKSWSLSNLRPLNSKQNLLDGVHRVRHKK
jgi:hypothetical protein